MPAGTELAIYLVLAPFISVFIYGVYLRIKSYGGIDAIKFLTSFRMIDYLSCMRNVLLQRKMVNELYSGFMHVAIMYGAIVLFIGSLLIFIEHDVLRFFGIKILMGNSYLIYESLLDMFGLLFITGLVLAINRRIGFSRLKRLREKNEYTAILAGLLFIGLTGFILEGLRLRISDSYWSKFSPVGWLISELFRQAGFEKSLAHSTYQIIWWIHALTAFSLVASIPYTTLIHSFLAAINASQRRVKEPSIYLPSTPFRLAELSDTDLEVKIGYKQIAELSPPQRIAIDSCTDCGRCEEACPATASGTPLSPRTLIQKLRLELRRAPTENLFEAGILGIDEVYACTTCGACVYSCPALINPLEYILEARRSLVSEGRLERQFIRMLTNLSRTKNPLGLPRITKEDAVKELRSLGAKTLDEYPEAEYLYWLGCMALYDERIRKVAKSLLKIMIKCGVSFAILGTDEVCTGDPARRVGEEGRYQELAYHNIETLRRLPNKTILTHCPHCYNIFKNEYRDLGVELRVIHHTELLAMLVASGKLKPPTNSARLTLHDSCYLARYNKIINEPRTALSGTNLLEMKHHGRDTFCCGGGGGNYWYEVKRIKRESVLRIEEAIQTGADVLVVECPYCLAMLEDAAKATGNEIKVLDIAEVFEDD
jgi:Fe-S oxidoreductase/nitrate reductase gamma subunit